MKTKSEHAVNDILPCLRAAISQELISQYHMNQSEVAEKLGVSQPAISQYLRKLRGNKKISENEIVASEIKELCTKIYSGKVGSHALPTELWNICKIAMELDQCPLCFKNA